MAWTASLRRTSALRLDLHSRLWCRLDSSLAVSETPFRFQIAAAWHGKPPEPDEPARKRPRFAHQPGPTTESPLLRYREALLTSLEPRRIMGDDSLFTTELADGTGVVVGVADGVGGWADQGVDPSIFATGLMFHAQELASQLSADPFADAEQTDSFSDPRTLLADAYDRVLADGDIVAGSSTACIATISADGAKLKAANLGDSSFYLARNGKVVYMQPAQTHYFNCPRQLSKGGGSDSITDLPRHADLVEAQLEAGDIVILATDGFTDNVWPQELQRLLELSLPDIAEEGKLQRLCEAAVEYARVCGFKVDKRSPFEAEAAKHGLRAPGGKVDDVTLVAIRVMK